MKPVSGRRMCKALERAGWVNVRIKGSHHSFRKDGEEALIVVPVHGNKDLKPGTQASIMRDADLEDDDL